LGPLRLEGETDPLAVVNFYLGGSGILASASADMSGLFSASPFEVTQALEEGLNHLRARAVKGAYTSPIAPRELLYDLGPPMASSPTPVGPVATLSPSVGVTLSDPGVSTTTTSGISPDVVSLRVNGLEVPFSYNPVSGAVVWIDSATGTAPVLSTGTFAVVVEAGD